MMNDNENRISKLFQIQYPVIQGGMVWCSGWELASAVSNAGGLGLIGAGSMSAEVLRNHIRKCKAATSKPFGVNLPLLYMQSDEMLQILVDEQVPIVFTSAGNPAKYSSWLKSHGLTVVHVIANIKFALKAVEAGVDAIVAEGFEAGGHNGMEETTTMTLIPMIREKVNIPLIAAGGIATGRQMLAAFALGAEGVQIGSLFAVAKESSAHENYKNAVINAGDGATSLMMKQVVPVRLLKNAFSEKVRQAELSGAGTEELRAILGRGRSRLGIFEGNLDEGELEIGQVAALIRESRPVSVIMQNLLNEYREAKKSILPDFF
jgi:enoyl-[acyl-carrier protein] reductase II